MKFFKKLSGNNISNGPHKKLLFLKNKKDKVEKSKIHVDASSADITKDNESWLDLNLPEGFSSSLDILQFEQNQEQNDHSADDNTLSNVSINTTESPEPFKYYDTHHSTPSTTVTTTVTTTIEEIEHQSTEVDKTSDLNRDEPDTSLLSFDLECHKSEIGSTHITENKEQEIGGVEYLELKQENTLQPTDNAEEEVNTDMNDYGESADNIEKEKVFIEEESAENVTADLIPLAPSTTQQSNENNSQIEDVALLPASPKDDVLKIVEIEYNSEQFTPQIEQGPEISVAKLEDTTLSGIDSTEKHEQETNTVNETVEVSKPQILSNINKKKDLDKKRPMQSFIPRKQFQQPKEEMKKVETKEKKRQKNNSHGSSIPILSSTPAANKLTINTTVVVDASSPNDYYYAHARNISPSSTTSTSTTTTNTSDHSHLSSKKHPQKYKNKVSCQSPIHSKIPVASNIPSSKLCSTQHSGTQHHASRLPKKLNHI